MCETNKRIIIILEFILIHSQFLLHKYIFLSEYYDFFDIQIPITPKHFMYEVMNTIRFSRE